MSTNRLDDSDRGTATTRRDWIGAAAGIGLATALLGMGCGEIRKRIHEVTGPAEAAYLSLPGDSTATAAARRVLNRAAFGPRPGDIVRLTQGGAAAWLEDQLADRMQDDPTVDWRVNALDTQQTVRDAPDVLYCTDYDELQRETAQAALLRAVYSRHQLRETLADFWTNHFNIYSLKNDGRALVPVDTETVIRPHVLGSFHDMLVASAHSPAMLGYLDNNLNQKRDPQTGGGANENYGRELLELHTLGVHSGYTLKDIQQVARCFTGWSLNKGIGRPVLEFHLKDLTTPFSAFTFQPYRHDVGPKYIPFLNLTIQPNGGERDGDLVLETLAYHPATAHFLATKLCKRYLGHAHEEIVARAAHAYLKNKTSIRAMMRPILLDGLTNSDYCTAMMKRPLDLTISALRCIAADTDGGENIQRHLGAMGQSLYEWPMPDGFPEKASAWTGSLLPRWNFAAALSSNAIAGTHIDLEAPLRAAGAKSDVEMVNTLAETVLATRCDDARVKDTVELVQNHVASGASAGASRTVLITEATGLFLACPRFQEK